MTLDSITSLRDVPARTYRVFLICLIGVSFANLDHSLFTYVLTDISNEFHWSVLDRGIYIALTFVAAGLIVTQIGVLADRLGRKAVLLLATVLTPFAVAVMTFAPNTLILLILRALGFTLAGAQSPVTGTLVIEESPPRFRGLFSGILQIGFPIGFFVASLLVPIVYKTWGWRYIFLLSLLFLPYALVIWRYLEEPAVWLKARQSHAVQKPSTRELFRPALRRKTLLLFTGQLMHVMAFGATTLLTAYFREARGWDATEAIQMVGFTFLIGAFGYIAAAVCGEFLLSRRNTIAIWCILGGLAFGVMIWWIDGWWPTFVIFSLMTFFFYGAYAVIFTFIAENYPPELRATAASFASSSAVDLGLGLGPLALSALVVLVGWRWAFTWCAVLPVIVAGIVFLQLEPVPRDQG